MNNEPEENFDVDPVETNAMSETVTQEFIESYVGQIIELETLQEAIAARIKSLNERKIRIENAIKRQRTFILGAMQAINMKKIILPEATISIAVMPEHLIITDESIVPEDYWRVKRTINKERLNRAMKAGIIPPGTSLSNDRSATLIIRRK